MDRRKVGKDPPCVLVGPLLSLVWARGEGDQSTLLSILRHKKGGTPRSAPFAAQSQAGLAAGHSTRGDQAPRETGAMTSTEG